MISIWLMLIISSGSVFSAAFYKKRYEETLPLTLFSMIIILYSFALFNGLLIGVYFVTTLTILLYIASIIKVVKGKAYKPFLLNTFTPALVVFIILYIILLWSTVGMYAHLWDEFTYWADTVKAMYSTNLLSSNPINDSHFMSYPPAMSLLQYYFCKIKGEYSEWLLYFVKQIFGVSLILPFMSKIKRYNIFNIIIISVSVFGALAGFFAYYYYSSLYIDNILGLLFGFLMIYIFFNGFDDVLSFSTIFTGTCVMILMKDAGKLFGFCVLCISLVIIIHDYFKTNKKKVTTLSLLSISSVLYPVISWNEKLKIDKSVLSFSNKYDLKNLFEVIMGYDTGYRRTVIKNFIKTISLKRFCIGSINIPHLVIFILTITAFYAIWKFKLKDNKSFSKTAVLITFIVSSVIFIIGLLLTYMYKFAEVEAVVLASFDRYMSIIWTAVIMFLLAFVIAYIQESRRSEGICRWILVFTLLLAPFHDIVNFIDRKDVKVSAADRAAYVECTDIINRNQDYDKNEKIYIISQEDSGNDYWHLRYLLKPDYVSNNFEWSLGKPYYADDIYSRDLNVSQWKDEFSQYDYVIIYTSNEYFTKTYKDAFEDPNSIKNNSVYRVDKDRKILIQLH